MEDICRESSGRHTVYIERTVEDMYRETSGRYIYGEQWKTYIKRAVEDMFRGNRMKIFTI